MSSSNQKAAAPREAPQEPFKRAIAGCLRAMARAPELEITFAPEKSGVIGIPVDGKVRLTEPPRHLSARDAAVLRGQADSAALRAACHDPRAHLRRAPQGPSARAIFDGMEWARVEAIGARRMQGVAQNLTAALEDKYERGNYSQIRQRSDAPLEDALALLVRERLTGMPPPPAAVHIADLWRENLKSRVGGDLARLTEAIENQRQFGNLARKILADLDMAERGDANDDDDEDEASEDQPSSEQTDNQGDGQEDGSYSNVVGLPLAETAICLDCGIGHGSPRLAPSHSKASRSSPSTCRCRPSSGLPTFAIVGLPDKAVGESKERVRAAIHALGLSLPAKRIIVNLSPADIVKEGSHFDLPIAIGLLISMGVLPQDEIEGLCHARRIVARWQRCCRSPACCPRRCHALVGR